MNFDVTLMAALIRNLTKLTPPTSGYDNLPLLTDTSPTADLTRIKYYRNEFAHITDGKIEPALFITAWENITGVSTYQRLQLACYLYARRTFHLHKSYQYDDIYDNEKTLHQ